MQRVCRAGPVPAAWAPCGHMTAGTRDWYMDEGAWLRASLGWAAPSSPSQSLPNSPWLCPRTVISEHRHLSRGARVGVGWCSPDPGW